MEEYQIAFSPEIGIDAADFVVAWNEESEARTNGEARLDEDTSNAIYDLIKKVFAKKGMLTTHTHFEELNMPDETHLLIVDRDDKQL